MRSSIGPLQQPEQEIDLGLDRPQARKDFVILGFAMVIVLLGALHFETSIAQWLDRQGAKIDAVIVVAFCLAAGFAVFSVRRWRESRIQIDRYQHLHERMNRLSREAALLDELGDSLQSCLTTDEAYKLITGHAQFLFPGSSGAVCVTASSRDLVEAMAVWGKPILVDRCFPPGDCWALRRGRVHVQDLNQEHPTLTCAHIGELQPAMNAICVPMMAHGEGVGVLYLNSRPNESRSEEKAGKQPLESTVRLAKRLAESTALALANLNLREVLRAQSIRDPLTGLFNRRYMEESLERELSRATRKKQPLSIAMLDVDHFKHFNDSFGHDAGDTLLRELARLFRTTLRAEDIICRYGGEEFAMILPDAPLQSIQGRIEQLREKVRDTIAQHRGQPLDRVTVSVGIATYPEHGTTSETLLRAADAALYQAKAQGRDRVVLA